MHGRVVSRACRNGGLLLLLGFGCFLSEIREIRCAPSFQEATAEPQTSAASALYLRSPFGSMDETQSLIDLFRVRMQVQFGYREADASSRPWRCRDLPEVGFFHGYTRAMDDGSERTLEVATVPYPTGGFDILLYGGVSSGALPFNPDLEGAFRLLEALSSELADRVRESTIRNLAYEVYPLSYIHADRAMALLKALDYTTVEYSQEPSDKVPEEVYAPIRQGSGKLPIVVRLLDSTKTSLLDPPPLTKDEAAAMAELRKSGISWPPGSSSTVPEIGGTYLHAATSGEPQQRLLVVYEKGDTTALQNLLNLLRDKIDVPARQIVIEALVIELNSDKLKDLGVDFTGSSGHSSTSFGAVDSSTGDISPFSFTFDSRRNAAGTFRISLSALIDRGDAEVLSKPSVLVLDGRQARIQIGQQVPVVKSTSTEAGIISSVDYFQVGIVLNLRPRVSEDGSEITMQAETIVSAVNRLASAEEVGAAGVLLAPIVDSRQVQSFVRVADNSPFIIGGLISTERQERITGIPFLSNLPGVGGLFRRTVSENTKREVIVVLTPHVVPPKDRTFSYVIPKDVGLFDSFGYQLFRNSYRVRGQDVFDLNFVLESKVFQDLLADVRTHVEAMPSLRREQEISDLLAGAVPGEEILVTRMLWEIVDKTGYASHVQPEKIILFEEKPDSADGSGFELHYLKDLLASMTPESNGLLLSFRARAEGTPEHPFAQPTARVSRVTTDKGSYVRQLIRENRYDAAGNPADWSILLSESSGGIRVSAIELLRGVLALKRVLELNRSLPLTIRDFHVGRQITFPSEEELESRYHLIDREAARLFFQIMNYYPSFEREFNRRTRELRQRLESRTNQP